jgi:hypothetical protein
MVIKTDTGKKADMRKRTGIEVRTKTVEAGDNNKEF